MLRKIAVAFLLLLFLFSVGYATVSIIRDYTAKYIDSGAHIKTMGVEVYLDANCTSPCDRINWGDVFLRRVYSFSVFIENIGVGNVTLSLRTENWLPNITETWVSFTWDYSNGTLTPGQVEPVTFFLAANNDAEDVEFTFTIVVEAHAAQNMTARAQ